MASPRKFRATLEPDGTDLHWVIARVPFDPTEAWPHRVGLRVKGTIAAAAKAHPAEPVQPHTFRTSLFSTQKNSYLLLVNKQMQKAAKLTLGSLAQITLEPDLEERSAAPPPELIKLLKQDRALRKYYEQFSYSMRKEIADRIQQPKSPEARIRRAEQMAERMMLAMEGEHQTPPILEAAFRRQPHARIGWQSMTPIQRRSHLLAIFYYQSPASRQTRADKAIAQALQIARKQAPAPQ